MSEDDKKAHDELQSRLILEEIRSLQKRINIMETQIEGKIDRLADQFRADHRDLETKVHDMEVKHEVAIAVLKNDVNLKTTGIAIACSGFIAIVSAVIQYMN